MRIIGCDLHTRQQSIAMFDTETKEVLETTLSHEGDAVLDFYRALPRPALVGIEATGAMCWFLQLMEERALLVWWVIQRRFVKRRPVSRSTTGGMPRCCCAC